MDASQRELSEVLREARSLLALPNNCFDWSSWADGDAALTEVDALSLSRSALLTLMEARPRIAIAAIAFLCERLRSTDTKMEAIALYPIEARLARFLLSAVQLQSPGAKGNVSHLSLDMSQGELALLLGASRPKVNKALATLEEAEAVRRNGAELICDLEMLRAYADVE